MKRTNILIIALFSGTSTITFVLESWGKKLSKTAKRSCWAIL